MARKRDLETSIGNPSSFEGTVPEALEHIRQYSRREVVASTVNAEHPLPAAPAKVEPAHAQAAVLAAMEGHSLVWEKGFKVGRGLEPSAARPYAEGVDGKRPCDLVPMPKDEERDFDAGFVAGFKSRAREYQGARS